MIDISCWPGQRKVEKWGGKKGYLLERLSKNNKGMNENSQHDVTNETFRLRIDILHISFLVCEL